MVIIAIVVTRYDFAALIYRSIHTPSLYHNTSILVSGVPRVFFLGEGRGIMRYKLSAENNFCDFPFYSQQLSQSGKSVHKTCK